MGQMIGRCVATEDMHQGDLIEIPRLHIGPWSFYSHWTVYIGNKLVIHKGHITNGKKGSEVRIQSLHKFAGKGKIVKNNSLDKKMRPFHPETILTRALSKIGDDSYNIFTNNCEHFATWCRYGIPVSEQVITCIRYCKYSAVCIISLILFRQM
ncbi:HRAS-like suppressor 3 [Pomacea canaliculata]|uniref:HRAS-like suppressor 3 n=1 Tax=Pomacea canaliculata TaxID=400727 RepID=UPI000D72B2D1|nr:HRAS-like suppressor 3 [Pomacea canaliculata]